MDIGAKANDAVRFIGRKSARALQYAVAVVAAPFLGNARCNSEDQGPYLEFLAREGLRGEVPESVAEREAFMKSRPSWWDYVKGAYQDMKPR